MLSTCLNVAVAVGSVLANVVRAAPGGVADLSGSWGRSETVLRTDDSACGMRGMAEGRLGF